MTFLHTKVCFLQYQTTLVVVLGTITNFHVYIPLVLVGCPADYNKLIKSTGRVEDVAFFSLLVEFVPNSTNERKVTGYGINES